MQRLTTAPLVLVLFASLSGAQTQIFRIDGDNIIDRFGSSVAGVGDVNGDGFGDVAAGAPLDDEGGFSFGSAQVFSGANGERLHAFFGDQDTSTYGQAVAAAGDVNGDGHADVIVGDRWHEIDDVRHGRATVYSGLDGSVIYFKDGAFPNDDFGCAVAGIGDVNKDGFAEFAVGAPLNDEVDNGSGQVTVYDGQTGTCLYTLEGLNSFDQLGMAIRDVGDVNADNYPDFIVSIPGDDTNGLDAGAARIFSGPDGVEIRTHYGRAAGDDFGAAVSGAGDVDGDGGVDVIVGATQFPLGPGYAQVFSGPTGDLLFEEEGTVVAGLYGIAVSGCGDLDGDGYDEFMVGKAGFSEGVEVFDGETLTLRYEIAPNPFIGSFGVSLDDGGLVDTDDVPDLVIGAPNSNFVVLNGGSLHLHSGAELALSADEYQLGLAAGGTQTFTIDAGASQAGAIYWVLGSASGTSPGTTIGGIPLPLNTPDGYFDFTVNRPNSPVLQNSLAVLDGAGQGQMQLVLPPNTDPSLAGVTVYHAFLVFELGPLQFHVGSNAVSTFLLP